MGTQKMRRIGVVGLGLMGSSIIVSFLNAGYVVVALTPLAEEYDTGSQRIFDQLRLCHKMGLLKKSLDYYISSLIITTDYKDLSACDLVVECVIEIEEIKAKVYKSIEETVNSKAVIATNTSAIPISKLQEYLNIPNRFIGIHWAEPAYATRFLEITCGAKSDKKIAEYVKEEAENWEKEPTLLYKDIRGFITNRLMYAVYREGFHLMDNNVASMASLDKCFQYDIGSWISIMGIFKRMDYIGLKSYLDSYAKIFPKLSNTNEVPEVMTRIASTKGRGIHNLDGLYPHTEESAAELDKTLASFNEEIYRLVDVYRAKKAHLNL